MRVLHVLPSIGSESGGPVRSTLANCRALHTVDSGVSTTLATTGHGLDVRWRETLEARLPAGMKLEVFPGVGRHAFMVSPRLIAWLWGHVRDFDLVVVRALLHPVSSTAAWVARRRDVPYLLVPHGTLSRYTFEHRRTLLKRAYVRVVERHTLEGAAAVRFTSEPERREAAGWVADTASRVIPHPYEPWVTRGGCRNRRPHQILFLSRLHPKKGVDTLLEAFVLVLAEIPTARLVLAGSGTASFERHVEAEIHRLGLEESVRLPGFVEGEEKARLFAESAVFVLPSRQENFGMAAVEAMDAGLPVVISRGVDIWSQVEEAGAGIVVQERTPAAVAKAVLLLLRDASLRYELGRKGKELVRTAFDPQAVGRKLVDFYRSATDGYHGAPCS